MNEISLTSLAAIKKGFRSHCCKMFRCYTLLVLYTIDFASGIHDTRQILINVTLFIL